MWLTPLAFFAFNRPRHTERALRALAACSRLEECRIIIHCDGPKRPEHAASVAEVRRVVRHWAPALGAEIIEQPVNRGLAHSIADTVTSLVNEHGRVIVLEDDLVPSPDCISFTLDALDRYEHADEVAQISLCNICDWIERPHDAFFLTSTGTWGWATWARAWSLFRWEDGIDFGMIERDPELLARLTLDGAADFDAMLRARLDGRNDSWGILWLYAIARAHKLVLYPSKSVVWNGGFDGSGVHCQGKTTFAPAAPAEFSAPRLVAPYRWPARVELDGEAYADLRRFIHPYLDGTATAAPLRQPRTSFEANWLRLPWKKSA